MANREDLPFLLSLLEDNSTVVQQQIRQELLSFGPTLDQEVEPFLASLDDIILERIQDILSEIKEHEFSGSWLGWMDMADRKEALEYALIHLAVFEYGSQAHIIADELDKLAEEFTRTGQPMEVGYLMEFLFQKKGFRSPLDDNQNHLYDNLLFILKGLHGSQLGLSCLAILVGKRLGIDLDGINIQGNFMAISFEKETMRMFNSFNGGKPLARASVMYIEEAFRRNKLAPLEMKAKVHEIVIQVLKNAIDLNHRKNRLDEAKQYVDLYKGLLEELKERKLVE